MAQPSSAKDIEQQKVVEQKAYIKRCVEEVGAKLEGILAMLRIGHTRTAAAKAHGIKPAALSEVCAYGRNTTRTNAHQYLIKILNAESMAQVELERLIIEDARVNVKTAQWFLARRFRLKERHEPDIEILRELDKTKLKQERVKLAMLESKLRYMNSNKDMDANDWRELFSDAGEANKRVKSIH